MKLFFALFFNSSAILITSTVALAQKPFDGQVNILVLPISVCISYELVLLQNFRKVPLIFPYIREFQEIIEQRTKKYIEENNHRLIPGVLEITPVAGFLGNEASLEYVLQ